MLVVQLFQQGAAHRSRGQLFNIGPSARSLSVVTSVAALTFKRGYGFHPLCAFVDHGASGTGEPLAISAAPGQRRLQHRRRSHGGAGRRLRVVTVAARLPGRAQSAGGCRHRGRHPRVRPPPARPASAVPGRVLPV